MPSTREELIVPDELFCSSSVNNLKGFRNPSVPASQTAQESVYSKVWFICCLLTLIPHCKTWSSVDKILVATSSQDTDICKRNERNEKFMHLHKSKFSLNEEWGLTKNKTPISQDGQKTIPPCLNCSSTSYLPSLSLFSFVPTCVCV